MLSTAKDFVDALTVLGPYVAAAILYAQVRDLRAELGRYRRFFLALGAKASGIEFKDE